MLELEVQELIIDSDFFKNSLEILFECGLQRQVVIVFFMCNVTERE